VLVNNTGINDGDLLDLRDNPLSVTSCTVHIPQLEIRGVSIDSNSCP